MKISVSMLALAVALAFSGIAYAAEGGEDKWDAKTEADCVKAGGVWIADSQDCEAPGDQPEEQELQQENE
jgi:hypothetical protein